MTLNKLKMGDKLFMGYCWIPSCEIEGVYRKIEKIKADNKNIDIPIVKKVTGHGIKPPTFFKTNEFTAIF